MLRHRLIFGLIMVLVVLGLFYADSRLDTLTWGDTWTDLFGGRTSPPPGLVLLGLLIVLIPLAARELVGILRALGITTSTTLITISAWAAGITIYATPISLHAATGAAIIATVLIACFVVTLFWHARHAKVNGAVAAAGATMFAVTYLGLMGGFFLAIRRWHSAWVVLAVILITKMGDTGAYFTGRAIGKHKLIPWLSPGKTWEGLAGAVVWSTLFAVGFAALGNAFPDLVTRYPYSTGGEAQVATFNLAIAAGAGALLALFGHVGDLTMSLFKRDAGVKDSGNVLPGFGGVLDVLDSPLLIAPIAYWMLELVATYE